MRENGELKQREIAASNFVEVESLDNLTLTELEALARENTIFFTPHVGNKYREDLVLMNIGGVRTANFGRNASVLDVLDAPELLKTDGESYPIAHLQARTRATLTPHLLFGDDLHERPRGIIENLSANRPAQLHHKSTRLAVPGSRLQTDGEAVILGEENQMIRDMIDQLHRTLHKANGQAPLQIFSRYVDRHGEVYYLDEPTNRQFLTKDGQEMPQIDRRDIGDLANMANDFFTFSEGITRLINTGEVSGYLTGPMPRNELMVLLLGLKPLLDDIQMGKFNSDLMDEYTAYAISGPSMIKYAAAKDFKRTISMLYEGIREIAKQRFQIKMPARLKIKMIPGANLSYLPTTSEIQAVDAITAMVRVQNEYAMTQRSLAEAPNPKPQSLLDAAMFGKKRHVNAVADVVAAVREAPHISQYDLLNGVRLMDPEVVASMTFRMHGLIVEQIRKANRPKPPKTDVGRCNDRAPIQTGGWLAD